MGEEAVPSSSPIFFQSSPTKGNNNTGAADERMGDASSTVDDGERTPRGNPGVRGMNSGQLRLDCDGKIPTFIYNP